MTIQEYYLIIISRYNSGDYKLKIAKTNTVKPVFKQEEFPLLALNYLIFEYLKDNKDDRWKLLLDFILVPNGVNQEGCDIDFTKIEFEEFFDFMLRIKN